MPQNQRSPDVARWRKVLDRTLALEIIHQAPSGPLATAARKILARTDAPTLDPDNDETYTDYGQGQEWEDSALDE